MPLRWCRPLELSDDLIPELRERLGIGLEREDAVELYYNFAVTKWLGVSLDLQTERRGHRGGRRAPRLRTVLIPIDSAGYQTLVNT